MDICFVLVSFNSENYLAKCISSINSLRCKANVSIVVVDNNSCDNSLAIARSVDGVQLISLDENIGFGGANNIGVGSKRSDYYFVFNVDAYFETSFDLDRVIAVFEKEGAVAAAGVRLQYPDGSPQTASFVYSSPSKWFLQILPFYDSFSRLIMNSKLLMRLALLLNPNVVSYQKNHDSFEKNYSASNVDWVSGAAMIIRGEYVQKHGLFDDNIFLYGEDEDLCLMIKDNGYEVVLIDSHPVTHVHGWNSINKDSLKVSHLKYQSLKYFIEKNFKSFFKRKSMKLMLPIYVYGYRGLFRGLNEKAN